MVKVDNRDTLRDLTQKFMEMNRGRNCIAVLGIMLTCLLFTSLFTGAVSMILSKRAADIKQFQDSSHAIAQNLSEEEYAQALPVLEENPEIAHIGSGIFLGSCIDERFTFSAELRYGDVNMAESFQQLPQEGRMPLGEDEIAVGTVVLDALELPHELGTEVTLSYEKNPNTKELAEETFRLCGYWESDKALLGQMLWVSKIYAQQNYYPVTAQELEDGIYQGGYDIALWYHNLWNYTKKTEQLAQETGLTDGRRGLEINPAYDLMEEDAFSFGTVGVLVLLILLAGYLIIYNIFQISVKTDIRTYGLLKNIGTTGRQLKKIVRMQVWRLSIVGIPLGLLGGYLVGVVIAPSLNQNMEISAEAGAAAETVVSANPAIFLGAGLLTLLTVYLSSMKACRLVEEVTPVEALRIAENDLTYRKTRACLKIHSCNLRSPLCGIFAPHSVDVARYASFIRDKSPTNLEAHLAESNFQTRSRKKRAGIPLGWFSMAIQNFERNFGKGLIVMLSIALTLVVINGIVMLVRGYDFKAYQKAFLTSEFQISQMPFSIEGANFEVITPRIKKQIKDCPYNKGTGLVYYSEESHKMEPELKTLWQEMEENYGEDWNGYEKDIWEQSEDSGDIKVHLMGINQEAFSKLEWRGDSCSWNEFKTGEYILVDYNNDYGAQPISYYQIGDAYEMEYKGGEKKSYKVLGEAILPYSLDYPYADFCYITVLIPEIEFISYTGMDSAMYAAMDCDKEDREAAKQYLENTVMKENDLIQIFSTLDMERSFQKYISKYYMIGTALAIVLGFIGIMNFFNTIATSMISRKREFALLEAVGMTKNQILKMLIAEGCIYLLGAELMAVVIVCTCMERLLGGTLGMAFFFRFQVIIWPCLVLIPILVILVVGISKYQFDKMSRESIVRRISSM